MGDFYEDFHLQTGEMPSFLGHGGLVGCAVEFLGRIVLEFGCVSPADVISEYCMCVSSVAWNVSSMSPFSQRYNAIVIIN